jgi:hypothetical protein
MHTPYSRKRCTTLTCPLPAWFSALYKYRSLHNYGLSSLYTTNNKASRIPTSSTSLSAPRRPISPLDNTRINPSESLFSNKITRKCILISGDATGISSKLSQLFVSPHWIHFPHLSFVRQAQSLCLLSSPSLPDIFYVLKFLFLAFKLYRQI